MMKIVQINTTCGTGSTGKICLAVSEMLTQERIENYILYTQGHSDYPLGIKFADDRYKKIQALKSRVLGNYGFNSQYATKRLIEHLERIQPDIVHLHNVHGHDCDLDMLFRYFKRKRVKLFWTFHDCWAFTGYCPHFTLVGCDKWKISCEDCVQSKKFSWFVDRSKVLFSRKKELFLGLDMTIITPSEWLADLVRVSFLKDYPVEVIHNGIDLSVFKPSYSDFRERYQCEDKFILLGVSFGWGFEKGLDFYMELAKRLDDRFQIVLIGTDEKIDKILPKNIITVHKTENQRELAETYTAANLFLNLSREENYPTVDMEAISCGTPVLTFRVGGGPEIVGTDAGVVLEKNDLEGAYQTILEWARRGSIKVKRNGKEYGFDQNERFADYLHLYKSEGEKI